MTAIDDLVTANARLAPTSAGDLPGPPSRQLAVVTCMDCRIDPLAAFGLRLGDAHVVRNAGGVVTDDVVRSLVISQRKLGTREIALVQHTGCGLLTFTDDAFTAELTADAGTPPPWSPGAFDDLESEVRRGLAVLRGSPYLPYRDAVRGFTYDLPTGLVTEVG